MMVGGMGTAYSGDRDICVSDAAPADAQHPAFLLPARCSCCQAGAAPENNDGDAQTRRQMHTERIRELDP